jgi:hypothetical protein
VVFEASPDERHAIGEQRRGERIALEAAKGFAVQGEGNCPIGINAPG